MTKKRMRLRGRLQRCGKPTQGVWRNHGGSGPVKSKMIGRSTFPESRPNSPAARANITIAVMSVQAIPGGLCRG
jgi:hypothetical protein